MFNCLRLWCHGAKHTQPTDASERRDSSGQEHSRFLAKNLSKTYAGTFLPINYVLVHPSLEHCVQVWSPYSSRADDSIEHVQEMVIRSIMGFRRLAGFRCSRLGGEECEGTVKPRVLTSTHQQPFAVRLKLHDNGSTSASPEDDDANELMTIKTVV